MMPGNGVYRVFRRRFAEVRSGSTIGGSTSGGFGKRRLRQRILQRPLGKHRHPSSFLLDAFYLNRERSELRKARVKHARKCIKTVGAGRRGVRAGDLVTISSRGSPFRLNVGCVVTTIRGPRNGSHSKYSVRVPSLRLKDSPDVR